MYKKKIVLLVCLLCGLQSSPLHANVKNVLLVLPGFITGWMIHTQVKKPLDDPRIYWSGFALSVSATAYISKKFFDANKVYSYGYYDAYNIENMCVTGWSYSLGLLAGTLWRAYRLKKAFEKAENCLYMPFC